MLSHSSASTAPVRLEDLPPALIDAATRVCREPHNDPPEAVQEMLVDLAYYPPASWDWLTAHFTAQLPALPSIATAPATCGDCRHSRPTDHPAIVRCAAGVPSGLPVGGRWSTDPHDCPEFTDRQTGATRPPVKTEPRPTQTETFINFDPFSFLET
jgi:hypothetical protein